MKIINKIKKIANQAANIRKFEKDFYDETGLEGLNFFHSELISGCKEIKGHLYINDYRLDNSGLVDDLYYCYQLTGYCEDDFYGDLYFKTNVPGQFIKVPFSM